MAIFKVFSQDACYRLYISRVYVVLSAVLLAFLLISPAQALQLPKGCAKVASAWAKNPSVESLVQDPNFVTNSVDCIQGAIKLIQETDWQTVQAMIPYEVKDLIQNIRPNLIGNAKAFATGGGLVFLSSYLLFKSTELSEQAKGLELEYKMYREEFQLLRMELCPIISFIDTDLTEIVQHWKNCNNDKLIKKIEKMSEKLSRSSTVLRELVHRIHENIKKCESGKVWSVSYTIFAAAVCGGSIVTWQPVVFVPVCGIFVGVFAINSDNYVSFDKTQKKSECLRENAMEWRMEITKYRTNLDLFKITLEI